MWNLAWWADPIVFGKYPEDGLINYAADLPKITDADMALISEPIDYFAFNCYSGSPFELNAEGKLVEIEHGHGVGNARGDIALVECRA